jgi:hypothetical protein
MECKNRGLKETGGPQSGDLGEIKSAQSYGYTGLWDKNDGKHITLSRALCVLMML